MKLYHITYNLNFARVCQVSESKMNVSRTPEMSNFLVIKTVGAYYTETRNRRWKVQMYSVCEIGV